MSRRALSDSLRGGVATRRRGGLLNHNQPPRAHHQRRKARIGRESDGTVASHAARLRVQKHDNAFLFVFDVG